MVREKDIDLQRQTKNLLLFIEMTPVDHPDGEKRKNA